LPQKTFPLNRIELEKVIETFPTPFHIYDEKAIRENARALTKAFSAFPGFTEYFAVKALPNPYILKILASEGFGADCSSLSELLLAKAAGITGENIIFTSNDTPAEEFVTAKELGAIINLDDESHIGFLESSAGLPDLVCLRYNPGSLREGNAIIGKPEEAKYGLTREQLMTGFATLKAKGVKRFGLHTMIASNELDYRYFVETGRMLFQMVAELSHALGIRFEFVNLGGGIGIPYRPDQSAVDYEAVADGIHKAYGELIEKQGLSPLKVYLECGRTITGPYGWLVSRVRHIKNTYRDYVGLDAAWRTLCAPASTAPTTTSPWSARNTRTRRTSTTSPALSAKTTTSSRSSAPYPRSSAGTSSSSTIPGPTGTQWDSITTESSEVRNSFSESMAASRKYGERKL